MIKTNKLVYCTLICILILGLIICKSKEEVNVGNTTVETQEVITNNILLNNELCKVIIKDKTKTEYGDIGYKVGIENKTDKRINVYMTNVSVNGVMTEPIFCEVLEPNTKVNTSLMWNAQLEGNEDLNNIDNLKNVRGVLTISDEDTYLDIYEGEFTIE